MAQVFALGSNGSGQLGIGHKEDVSVPKPVIFQQGVAPESVRKITAGGNHTLLLTGSGDVLWSGDADSGACGKVTPQQKAAPPHFRKVDFEQPFKAGMVAATWEASIVTQLDEQGKNTSVYSSGVGLKGELALGDLIVRVPGATKIPNFPPPDTEVVDLAACMGHVVAVLSNGDVYGWGNGRKGQIGAPEAVVHTPRKIEGVDFKVSRAVCGRDFTLLVGDLKDGKVLFLGADKLGIKSSIPVTTELWRDAGSGWGSVYVLKEDGTLVGWGRNDHGQAPPPELPPLSQIAIGSEHALALDKTGNVLTWGWGEHGNCGPTVDNGDVKGRWNVIASSANIPPGIAVTRIGAGCATSWLVLSGIPS